VQSSIFGVVGVDERVGAVELAACGVERGPVDARCPASEAVEVGDEELRMV